LLETGARDLGQKKDAGNCFPDILRTAELKHSRPRFVQKEDRDARLLSFASGTSIDVWKNALDTVVWHCSKT